MAKAAVTLPNVKKLLIDDNEISESGIEALMDLLSKTKKSHILGSLEENMPDEDFDEENEGHENLDKAVDDLIQALEQEHL